jgi:hypothetical protein
MVKNIEPKLLKSKGGNTFYSHKNAKPSLSTYHHARQFPHYPVDIDTLSNQHKMVKPINHCTCHRSAEKTRRESGVLTAISRLQPLHQDAV